MKEKQFLKKFLALVCVITMLTTSLGLQIFADASDTTNFTELTFASCGIEDGTYSSDASGAHPEGKGMLNNVAFTGNIQFANKTNDWNDALIFAGKIYLTYNAVNGELQLCNRVNNTYLHKISKAQLGADPAKTAIRVRLTFEYVSGTTDQVKYTFSANNVYNEGTITVVHSSIGAWMMVKIVGGQTIVESVYPKADGEEDIKSPLELTFADCGIADGSYSTDVSGSHPEGKGMLDNVAFTGNIRFANKTNDWNDALIFAGKFYLTYNASNGELQLCNRVNNTYLHKINKTALGVDPATTAVRVRFTFEYVSGTTDQVKYTFRANDVYNEGTITVAHSSIGAWMMVKVVGGETIVESVTEDNMGLSYLSFADFAIADGIHTKTQGGNYPGSMEDAILSGDVNFGTGTGESIIYGGTADKGLKIVHTTEGKLKVIADSNVAASLLNEEELEANSNNDNAITFSEPAGVDFELNMSFSISVEKGSYDSDGVADDAKVGIWTNGKLLGKRYLYLADTFDGNHFTAGCYVNGGNDNVIIKSVAIDTTRCRKLTLADFGIIEGVYSGNKNLATTAPESLLNAELSMMVQADNANATSTEDYTYIDYGEGESNLTELTFESCGIADGTYDSSNTDNGLVVGNHPNGKAMLNGVSFNAKVQFKDKTNDWNDAIIFSGKVYVTYRNDTGYLQFYEREDNSLLYQIHKDNIGLDPNTTLVPISMTFEYGNYDATTGQEVNYSLSVNGQEPFVGTYSFQTGLSAQVLIKVVNGETIVESVTDPLDSGKPGVRLQVMNDKITVKQTNGLFESFEIPSSVLGYETFNNQPFELALSYTMADLDRDGVEDKVRFSISVDGKLCANRYMEAFDLKTNHQMSIHPSQSQLTLKNVEFDSSDFDTLTIEDFGMEPTEFKYTNGGLQGHHVYNGGSLDGKIFSTNVKFSTYDALLFYGCNEANAWYSLYIGPQDSAGTNAEKDNRWRFLASYPEGILGSTQFIDATDAGVKLANNTFELGISTRNVDCDGDGQFDDLEVGLWFEGKLLDGSYIYSIDKADTLKPQFVVLIPTSRGSLTMGDIVETTPTEVEHCADKYAYLVDADTTTIVTEEGATYADGTTAISEPGVYNVTYQDADSTYMDRVTVYVTQDATADGVVTVQDLIRVKQLQKDATFTMTTAGKRAIAMEGDVLPETVLSDMHIRLLDSNMIGAKELSEDIVGEMGPTTAPTGSYITDVATTTEGTSVISISDNGDSEWESALAKSNGSGLDYVLDFDADREIKVLQITDTQILDSTQNTVSLSEQEIIDYHPENRDEMLWNEVDTLIQNTKPDVVLVTGDLIYGKYDHNGSAMQDLANHLDSYRIPWAPILGNHEQESNILTQGICDIFENAKYCLFTRRAEIGGNGNYAIGIAKNGILVKTIFMMDSNGCSGVNATDKANYVSSDAYEEGKIIGTSESFLLFDNQIAWYRTVAAKVNAFAKATVKSFLCVHVPPEEVRTAVQDMGLSDSTVKDWGLTTTEGQPNATIGFKNASDGKDEEDGGQKMDDYIYPYLQQAGTEGVFFGHCHTNSMSTLWQGIRWTYGLKTGLYESNPDQTGGTLITITDDTSFVVEHKVITDGSLIEE